MTKNKELEGRAKDEEKGEKSSFSMKQPLDGEAKHELDILRKKLEKVEEPKRENWVECIGIIREASELRVWEKDKELWNKVEKLAWEMARSDDWEIRKIIAYVIGEVIKESGIEELGDMVEELLEDENEEVRAYTIGGAYALWKKNPERWGDLWEKAKEKAGEITIGENWGSGRTVANAIGEFKIYELKHLLVVLAFSGGKDVREAAEKAMRKLGYKDVEELYKSLSEEEKRKLYKYLEEEASGSGDKYIRSAVAEIIGEFEIYKLRYLLIVLAYDGDKYVGKAAQEAIEKFGYKDVKELYERLSRGEKEELYRYLEEASRSRGWGARAAVAKVIGEFGIEELGGIVEELLDDGIEEVRAYTIGGAYALWKKNPERWEGLWGEAKKKAREVVKSISWKARVAVAEIIGEFEIYELRYLLIVLAYDEDGEVRKTVGKVMRDMGFINAIYEWERIKEWVKEHMDLEFEDFKDKIGKIKRMFRKVAIGRKLGISKVWRRSFHRWWGVGKLYWKLSEEERERLHKQLEEGSESKSWEVKRAVPRTIGELGIYELRYVLVVLVFDRDKYVGEAAQEAMKKLGYKDVWELYRSLSEEEKRKVGVPWVAITMLLECEETGLSLEEIEVLVS